MTSIPAYRALAYQAPCYPINKATSDSDARQMIANNIARLVKALPAAKGFIGPDLKLVVLPEYVFTGYPLGETLAGWCTKAALEMKGPEYDRLTELATRADLYLAGNAYEQDPHFPNMYFQTSFIIAPSEGVILRYRRLNSMFAPTPHDVWDKYLDHYGYDGVFPVADTKLGRLACIASEEILYPEIARVLMLKGAEVLCHSSSEVGSPVATPKKICRLARAVENLAYVVSSNTGGMHGDDFPAASADGHSAIVDYEGRVMAEAGYGDTMAAHAELDVEALRRWRRRPGMMNLIARQRLELFAPAYSETQIQPANAFLEGGDVRLPDRSAFKGLQVRLIEDLSKRGVI